MIVSNKWLSAIHLDVFVMHYALQSARNYQIGSEMIECLGNGVTREVSEADGYWFLLCEFFSVSPAEALILPSAFMRT